MSKSLQQKNTRNLLLWLPLILVAGSILFYLLMSFQAHHMQEKQLQLKQLNVWNAFKAQKGNFDLKVTGEYSIDEGVQSLSEEPRDTAIFYPDKKKEIPFEIMSSNFSYNGRNYQVTTYISSTEITHLIIKVFIAEALIFILLLFSIVIINRKTSKKLWQPFYDTIDKITFFDITHKENLRLEKSTGIVEFDTLNAEITNLTDRANSSYLRQKEFVDNASHELQTPLAIIRSKIELLINRPEITEQTASLLADITDANNRLSQMNRNLLLLSRIENNQFIEKERINLSVLLEAQLNTYLGYYEGNIKDVKLDIQPDFFVVANRSLIDILITNLILNAIMHNIPDGYISAHLRDKRLSIENSGKTIADNPEQLFERFKKGSVESKTTGLGLSIARRICQLYEYNLKYQYKNNIHLVSIEFP